MRRTVGSLVLLSCVTFFVGLERQAITDSDEAYYAEASREMVVSGDWLTPRFNYEDRWQKPVLYYWLTAATYLIAGVGEGTARWWSAMSGLGLVLLTWAAARRMTRRDDAAWLAGAVTATCYGCFAMARLALPDLPLTFCITLTIWCTLERRWLIAGAAAGLGLLMKGPVALAVPLLVLLPIWWRERETRPDLRGVALAAVACAAIGLPWYGAMTLEHGSAYLQSFFVGDNLERFATDRFNEPRPLWFYIPILLGGVMPWSVFLLVLPWSSIVEVVRGKRRLTEIEWRLLIWAAVPLLFFTISIGKQPRYILPVLPPVAILLARAITTRVTDRKRGSWLAVATWGTAALYLVLAVLLYRARLLFIATYPWLTVTAIIVIVGCAVWLAWIAGSQRWPRLPADAAICGALLLLAVQFGALAGARPEPVERLAVLIEANRTNNEPVGTYQAFVRNLVFYTRVRQTDLFTEGLALDFITSPNRVLLVTRETDVPRLESITGMPLRRLARIRYLNAAGVRLRTILAPIPAQDFETIVLVSNR
jgi:4-amino-4-deoxy-L-arabinose transferase-like glycosyltransferase